MLSETLAQGIQSSYPDLSSSSTPALWASTFLLELYGPPPHPQVTLVATRFIPTEPLSLVSVQRGLSILDTSGTGLGSDNSGTRW